MSLYLAAKFLNDKLNNESYNGYGVEGFEKLLVEAGPFLTYLIFNTDKWEFAKDRTPFDASGYDTWLKFEAPGGDRKNTLPRSKDPEAKKIYTMDSDPTQDNPVFEVHYGRLVRMNCRHKVPKRLDWLEIFSYLTQFQLLDDPEKLAYLQERYDWVTKLEQLEEERFVKGMQKVLDQRIRDNLDNITRQIENYREQIQNLHRERILCQHQTTNIDKMKLDVQSVRRMHGVTTSYFTNNRLYVETDQLVVRYFDPAIYQRYRSNYYDGWKLELMDLVIAGEIEMVTSPIRIYINFNRSTHLQYGFDHQFYVRQSDKEHVQARHPHRTCRGNFENPIDQACQDYDIYGLMSNLLQWFQSLSFDDSHVCRVWLFETGGFRLTGEPDTIVPASDHRQCKDLIEQAKARQAARQTTEPEELALELNLELTE